MNNTFHERIPNEEQLLASLRSQWARLRASDAVRSGALVEMTITVQRRGSQVRLVIKSSEHLDAADDRTR